MNSQVGNEVVGGISGGERRRLTVALEMVHKPRILFLDEPTSGLDATSAQRLGEMLSNVSREGAGGFSLPLATSLRCLAPLLHCVHAAEQRSGRMVATPQAARSSARSTSRASPSWASSTPSSSSPRAARCGPQLRRTSPAHC